jgi:hypothetical protein
MSQNLSISSFDPSLGMSRVTLIAYSPKEVECIVKETFAAIRAEVDKDANANGGATFGRDTRFVPQVSFGTVKSTPAFREDPRTLAYMDPAQGRAIIINLDHPDIKNGTDKSLVKYTLTHEYLHSITDFWNKMGDVVEPQFEKMSLKEQEVLVDGIANLEEGITDVLAEKITGQRSPSGAYLPYRNYANLIIEKIGLGTVKKAYYQSDPDSLGKVFDAYQKIISFK